MVYISEEEYFAQRPDVIAHYGTPRHSGRYPWGSGHDEQTSQRNRSLLDEANKMRSDGLSDVDIAKGLGMTTTELRDLRKVVRNELLQEQVHTARKLKDKGLSNGAIAARLREAGYKVNGESQVRALLKETQERKLKVLDNVTNTLQKAVDDKGYIDVGAGIEYQLNTTPNTLRAALKNLRDKGYVVHNDIQIEQQGTGKKTNMKVLTKPGTTWGDVVRNRDNIQQVQAYSEDGGKTILNVHPPLGIDPKRVGVRYAEDGGAEADGVIYVRPGVKDVSLGGSRYAQVRIKVGDSHYLKGMAVYKDDLPEGTDLLFNTNKSDKGDKLKAMKPLKRLRAPGDDPSKPDEFTGPVDMDNPFGASIKRQILSHDRAGNAKASSAMNIVNEEGDWNDWSRTLSSQMLSKQTTPLAKQQLDLAYQTKRSELEGILRLTNPSVKRKLLEAFADGADSSAVHLKAAALPKQRSQVILPVPSMKDTEIYAPNFDNGTSVVLIRFPHGGTFEIPELKVNNRHPEAKKLLGDAKDAVGIHPKVAERLSGADFDGDSVLVIPNNLGRVKTSRPLEDLEKFDAKADYPPYPGMPRMTAHQKGVEMGKVSNLITDMTFQGATREELARAVKHSMVVIDAEKHELDWRRSERDNAIGALKKKYQGAANGGASTLISRAGAQERVLDRKLRSPKDGGPIDPKTGQLVYVPTNKYRTYVDANGKQHIRYNTIESKKLAETNDAHTLSSGTVIEKIYGDHSNRLKALANQARQEMVKQKSRPYNASAREAYKNEVASLDSKLALALRNAPLERQAQVFAGAAVRLKIQDNPALREREYKTELRRVKAQALAAARARTGADKQAFDITDAEWKAIQAGAVTANKLDKILTYADLDRIKKLATPKAEIKLTPTKLARAKALKAQDYSWAEIADALGVSVSTIQKELSTSEGGD